MEVSLTPDNSVRGFLAVALDAQRYDNHGGPPSECALRIAKLIPAQARVLDVGCGSGGLASLIRQQGGATVVGVEPDQARAEYTRSLGFEVYHSPLTEDLCQQLGQFDVVVFADVLEHVADPVGLLQLSQRVLRPGGCVILSVPNVAHWTIRLDLLRGRFDYAPVGLMDATHLRWFTSKTLANVIEAAAFQPVQRQVTLGLEWFQGWRPWRWLPAAGRQRLVETLAEHWPGVFGYQHLWKITPLSSARAE